MRPELVDALALLRSRDPNRISEALRLLQGTVYAFSMKLCGHREDAEDTMQDVLLSSLPHLDKLETPQAMAAWLYTVARNRCWRSRRGQAHMPGVTLSLDELMPDQAELQRLLQDSADGPETKLLNKEADNLLQMAVQRLPAPYRLVLVLHDMEDLEPALVAKILDLKEGTVRVRLHRARLAVRQDLAMLMRGEALPERASGARAGKCIQKRGAGKNRPDTCREVFSRLSEYLDQRLSPASCESMRQHIESCPACVAFLQDLGAAIERCHSFQAECESAIPQRLTELLTQEYLRMTHSRA